MKSITQAVILAGGLGTRMHPYTLKTPKPMVRIHGTPFLEYVIRNLRENNITRIVILVGYLHEVIEQYFGDGKAFGVAITYSFSPVNADTGTRIKNALPLMDSTFLLLYGDNYWPLVIGDVLAHYRQMNKPAQCVVYSNHDHATRDNVVVKGGLVQVYDRKRTKKNLSGVDIGYFILNKRVCARLPKKNFSFEDTIISRLVRKKQLAAYVTHHKYYGLSTPARIPMIEAYFRKRKIVFLDRDGVINKKAQTAQYITSWKQFTFLPKARAALLLLMKKGYEIYIISNQAGIARGMLSISELNAIHARMRQVLASDGVTITGIYVCPHGWDEGCFCRKPSPGLFFRAASDHFINLYDSYCIGDDERDIIAGTRAGCKTLLISPRTAPNLFHAVSQV